MSQYLPVGNFSWLRNMPTEEQIKSWQPDRKRGFILEVDLEYPPGLHDEHNAYPLAPEKAQVPEEWMSPYQQALAIELNLGKDRTQKLLLTLRDKTNYVLHYRNLQLYLSLGMKLKRVRNVLAFDQKDWMKSYISLNTELRKQATSTFEKNFFKLLNNSVFGKTMENLRNRTVVKLVRAGEEAKLRKLLSNPLFASAAVFGESLAGIQMHKERILMNKPVYTGMWVLELSKLLMYEFFFFFFFFFLMTEIHSFYSELYDEKSGVQTDYLTCPFLEDTLRSHHKLTDSMRETCEGQLTYSECFKVLSTFSNDKTPGNDGLTIEFYKFFWSEIGTFFFFFISHTQTITIHYIYNSLQVTVIVYREKKRK